MLNVALIGSLWMNILLPDDGIWDISIQVVCPISPSQIAIFGEQELMILDANENGNVSI